MILRSLNHDPKKIGFGQALRLVAQMGPEILNSPSNELLCMRDPKTGEYLSIEEDRVQIQFFKQLAKLATGTIELDQLREMSREIFPDLYDRKVNKNSRKQAVVFLCRQLGEITQRIPSLDDRSFWCKLEQVFPLR